MIGVWCICGILPLIPGCYRKLTFLTGFAFSLVMFINFLRLLLPYKRLGLLVLTMSNMLASDMIYFLVSLFDSPSASSDGNTGRCAVGRHGTKIYPLYDESPSRVICLAWLHCDSSL